ncbi:MAG: DPP IV N-terminal domain-containing protein [Gammaproteobacteria bacterium]|nr:DPP IV N-terminal domain-containing protein [Gammaproteobacteria bacterium]
MRTKKDVNAAEMPLVVFAALLSVFQAACSVQTSERVPTATENPPVGPGPAEYSSAFELDDMRLRAIVRNVAVTPHWMEGGNSLWFQREGDDGFEYIHVSTDSGEQRPLFDHAELARAVNAATGIDEADPGLTLQVTEYDAAADTVQGTAGGESISCSLQPSLCRVDDAPVLQPGLLASPNNYLAAFTRDHNLWIRNLQTGEERALTSDGEAHYAWGKTPDSSLAAIPERRERLAKPPYASFWSPDSRLLVTTRIDERDVGVYPFIEWAPLDGSVRPKLYQLRIPLLGDELPPLESYVFDLANGSHTRIDAGDGFDVAPAGVIGWSADSTRLYMLAHDYGSRSLQVLEYSGARTRIAFESSSPTMSRLNAALYNEPNVRLLKDGAEALWFSERSGWGHLYRINLRTGEVVSQLTSGDWTVHDVLHVDEVTNRVYFTAGGREPGDPYQRRVYSVNLDGSSLRLLTPEPADHQLDGAPSFLIRSVFGLQMPPSHFSPDGRFFVDIYSTLSEPPVSVLRSTEDGHVIAELERADVTALEAAGYSPPQRVSATAADGETTVWGAIYYPPDFDPDRRYPVINALYAGPQVTVAPANYAASFSGLGQYNRAALASLGFLVVTVDGRGTPYRSLAFQDVSRGQGHGTEPLNDHRAALEELAASRPYMDLSRVGVWGHSWGGYHAARAILQHNDFYDAAVASAGLHGYQWSYPGFEIFVGRPDYGGGSVTRPTPDAVPDTIAAIGNAPLVGQLKQGRLLIVYGELDENVHPAQAVQLMDALVKADRNFDVLYLPNRTHYYTPEPYFQRRLWDYLVEHVMGAQPPDFSILGPGTAE